MKKSTLLVFILIIFCKMSAIAQTCSCHELLDSLIKKVETDYAGYVHKVKEPGNPLYENLKKELEAKSENVTFADCYNILESYTEFFKDGHLFIIELPDYSPAQVDSLHQLIKHFPIPANYGDVLRKRTVKDSVEGIWKDAYNEQIAIVKKSENLFYGVIQKSNIPKWEPGMVKMEIERVKNNQYNISYYKENNFAKIHFTDAHIYKNVFLPFGIYRFAKVFPHNAEINYVNLVDPTLPVIKIIDKKSILLTVPSALIDRHYLDSLLDKYNAVIKATPHLIIDIRGNTGGNFIWGKLYDIANTIVYPAPETVHEDDEQLLASYDDAAYVKDRISTYSDKSDTEAAKYYANTIKRIKDNIGKIIGFSFYQSGPDTTKRIVYRYPELISIIIDKGVASAAEAFILGIKETSTKIILYGNNTKGEIDYSDVNTIPFGGKGNRVYYFGYPTLFSTGIKTHPNNPTGIKPDIYIPTRSSDWIQWVVMDINRRFKD